MRDSVTIHMNAPPDAIWALVSDVTRIGRYSPETFEATWIDGASGPAVGARFRGHVKRNEKGPTYWTTCEVVASDPGREFAFAVVMNDKPTNRWGYELAPAGDGTDVTESFALTPTLPLRLYWAVLGWARGKRNRNDMRRTLERVKAEVEQQD
jgi:Polyketide cyclase / dehydrase and lipid transport